MKTIMTFEVEEKEEAWALVNAVKNKVKIDTLYDEVFRKIIKHSDNNLRVKYTEELWEELSRHFE